MLNFAVLHWQRNNLHKEEEFSWNISFCKTWFYQILVISVGYDKWSAYHYLYDGHYDIYNDYSL